MDRIREPLLADVRKMRERPMNSALTIDEIDFGINENERTTYGPWYGQRVIVITPNGNGSSRRSGILEAAVTILQEAGEEPVRLGGVVLVQLRPGRRS